MYKRWDLKNDDKPQRENLYTLYWVWILLKLAIILKISWFLHITYLVPTVYAINWEEVPLSRSGTGWVPSISQFTVLTGHASIVTCKEVTIHRHKQTIGQYECHTNNIDFRHSMWYISILKALNHACHYIIQ